MNKKIFIILTLFYFINGSFSQSGWINLNTGTDGIFNSVYFINSNTGFAVADTFLIKTTNGGVNWSKIYFPDSVVINSVYFRDYNNGYIAGQTKRGPNIRGIWAKSTNSGLDWVFYRYAPQYCNYIYFKNSNTGFIYNFYVDLH